MPGHISLSLVSHTNAGKTTLARTLLGRDVGEVRDAPHVTEFADVFTMLETPEGETLRLWDTPGFGDSTRLVKRLRGTSNPLGWFLSAVWDRWRDRPFWASQQAMRNVRDEADVMLYLVNAAEAPEAAGYVAPEMELLGWIGKPVIVLLNQLGAPREGEAGNAEMTRWREHLAAYLHVKAVLPLDAFARCWVQEITLLRAIEASLEGDRRALMARLRAAWQARRFATFEAAMALLAQSLARLATAFEPLPHGGRLRDAVRGLGARLAGVIGLGQPEQQPAAIAQKALAERLALELRANTQALIRLHGLEGDAEQEILARIASHYELRLKLDEGTAAVWGGVVTGALAGLKADVLSGGLTMGGGLLAGGLLGALGGAGLARCVNLVRGTGRSWIAWNAEAMDQMVEAALLRYLAVAHFGRGRGQWERAEAPPHWIDTVDAALVPQREALEALWASRGDMGDVGDVGDASDEDSAGGDGDGHDEPAAPHAEASVTTRLASQLKPLLEQATLTVLDRLYPGTVEGAPPPTSPPARPT